MSRKNDDLVPCESWGQHRVQGEAECPHCGAPASLEPPAALHRRAFLSAAVAAGASLATGIFAYEARAQEVRAVPPYSVFPTESRLSPAPSPTPEDLPEADSARRVRVLQEALEAHRAKRYEEATALYESLSAEAPDANEVQQLIKSAEAGEALRQESTSETPVPGTVVEVPGDLPTMLEVAMQAHTKLDTQLAIKKYKEVLEGIALLRSRLDEARAGKPPSK